VSLTAPYDVRVTGQVRVAIQGGQTLLGTLENGKVRFETPQPQGRDLTLTATYLGSELALAAETRVTLRLK